MRRPSSDDLHVTPAGAPRAPAGMRRVLLLGCSGAGKSTLARRMSEILNLPLVHLDYHFWQPDWTPTARPQWRERVAQLVAAEAWVMDGNYDSSLDLRLPACDTVILLDFPRWRCMVQVVKRVVKAHFFGDATRPDLAPGCGEKWDWEFLEWVWNFDRDVWPKTVAYLRDLAAEKTLITLRTPAEVARFVDSLGPNS